MIDPSDPNIERLEAAIDRLGPVADEMVLVGGCAAGVLITDAGSAPIRPTFDVDLVVDLVLYSEYHELGNRLRARGFGQRPDDDEPICRWWNGDVRIDVMPVGDFLEFTNPWYSSAVENAVVAETESGVEFRHIDGPHFVATKLAAFESRGEGDPVTSHDVEDVVLVIDGRPSLLDEFSDANLDLKRFVGDSVGRLLDDRFFVEGLEGYFDRRVAVERSRRLIVAMSGLAGRS